MAEVVTDSKQTRQALDLYRGRLLKEDNSLVIICTTRLTRGFYAFLEAERERGQQRLTRMERCEDLLATDGVFRVALLVHLDPELVRLVDALRRDRHVPHHDVGALVARNLALRFHHGVLVRTVAQH